MTRLQRILAVTLVVQIILAAVVFWPRTSANAESGALFANLNTDDIVRLTLDDGEGQHVELIRQDDGWVLANSDDYPADSSKIEPVLAKIAAIQTNRLVTRSDASHKRLQVADDDFMRRIEMEMGDGTVETLLVGTAPNPRATHVRRAGQSETYLAGNLASWELAASARGWIDTTYVTLNRNELTRIVLENNNGTFTFEKGEDDTWTMADLPDGQEFDTANFNPILNQIVNLRLVKPLGTAEKPEYGLDNPQATLTVTITGEDGSTQTHTLRVGAQLTDGDDYVVKWSDSPYYVSVAGYSVENMINRTQDEFIKTPPTPTPDSEQ